MTPYANTDHAFVQLPDTKLWVYGSWDSHNTARLAGALMGQLDSTLLRPNLQWYREWLEPLQWAVVRMSMRGMLLDHGWLKDYREQLRGELRETDDAIRAHADAHGFGYTDKFPNSDPQVAKLLFDTLGLKATKRTEKGRPSVNTEALVSVLKALRKMDEPHREVLYNLCHRSRLQTIMERYLDLQSESDGRVRARVKMTGTKTWRFSYDEPALQQFPPEVRGAFRAAPGKVFVAVDYSQLEARILAHLAGDTPSLEVFTRGEDIHKANALDLFGRTGEWWQGLEDTPRKATRNFAKSFLYGVSYGGSAETMKLKVYCPCPRCAHLVPPTVNLKRDEVKQAELRWQRAHPAVGRFQTETADRVRRLHYYESPFGYRRFIGKPWGPELERELKNIPMQTGGALLMHQRQVQLDRLGLPIVLQHHDSFLFELPEGPQLDQQVADIRGIMEAPVPEMGGAVFPVDVKVGPHWGAV